MDKPQSTKMREIIKEMRQLERVAAKKPPMPELPEEIRDRVRAREECKCSCHEIHG